MDLSGPNPQLKISWKVLVHMISYTFLIFFAPTPHSQPKRVFIFALEVVLGGRVHGAGHGELPGVHDKIAGATTREALRVLVMFCGCWSWFPLLINHSFQPDL